MKEKLETFIAYVEDHLPALIVVIAGLRVITYFIEVIRRCVKK